MRELNRSPAINLNQSADMVFAEESSPVIIGIRLVGNDVFNRIEAALIGVLRYDDESKRTVADVIDV
jgi:hypothetical protein